MSTGTTKIFLTPIRPATLSSNPTGKEGAFYYNVGDKNFRYYDGTQWQPFGTGSGGGGGSIIIIDGGNAYSTYIYNLDGGGA